MLIGLSGFAGAGKDTVGQHLVGTYGFERRAFADKLKEAFCAYHNISLGQLEELKNDPAAYVAVFTERYRTGNSGFDTVALTERTFTSKMTVREALQRFGTEMGRDVFGRSFWLDQTLPPDSSYINTNTVVTDVRFPNEFGRIHSLGGINIRIVRDGLEPGEHASELVPADSVIDYYVPNHGTIRELYRYIDITMEVLGYDSARS